MWLLERVQPDFKSIAVLESQNQPVQYNHECRVQLTDQLKSTQKNLCKAKERAKKSYCPLNSIQSIAPTLANSLQFLT